MNFTKAEKAVLIGEYRRLVEGESMELIQAITGKSPVQCWRYAKGKCVPSIDDFKELSLVLEAPISAAALSVMAMRKQWEIVVNDKGETLQTTAAPGSKQRYREEKPALIESVLKQVENNKDEWQLGVFLACIRLEVPHGDRKMVMNIVKEVVTGFSHERGKRDRKTRKKAKEIAGMETAGTTNSG